MFSPGQNQHNYYQFVKGEHWRDGEIFKCDIRIEYVSHPPPPAVFWILHLHMELIRLKCCEGDFCDVT